tara:strand:- start:904 stop:1194 length:291 start_codon:yes stop_codon:yes gene_type:complete
MKINLKKILKILIIILVLSILIKSSFIIVKNTTLAFINSERFHNFLVNRVEFHLKKYLANMDLNNQGSNITNEGNLRKLIIKWKPTIDKIYSELGY